MVTAGGQSVACLEAGEVQPGDAALVGERCSGHSAAWTSLFTQPQLPVDEMRRRCLLMPVTPPELTPAPPSDPTLKPEKLHVLTVMGECLEEVLTSAPPWGPDPGRVPPLSPGTCSGPSPPGRADGPAPLSTGTKTGRSLGGQRDRLITKKQTLTILKQTPVAMETKAKSRADQREKTDMKEKQEKTNPQRFCENHFHVPPEGSRRTSCPHCSCFIAFISFID